jgi:hypothetical protein
MFRDRLSYVILFAHLRPVLKDSSVKMVFITCHDNLSEVHTFFKSFAFWLRKLNKRHEGDKNAQATGILPGEIYFDPNRDIYKFFGLYVKISWWKRLCQVLHLKCAHCPVRSCRMHFYCGS